jgi:hypothetical protein
VVYVFESRPFALIISRLMSNDQASIDPCQQHGPQQQIPARGEPVGVRSGVPVKGLSEEADRLGDPDSIVFSLVDLAPLGRSRLRLVPLKTTQAC